MQFLSRLVAAKLLVRYDEVINSVIFCVYFCHWDNNRGLDVGHSFLLRLCSWSSSTDLRAVGWLCSDACLQGREDEYAPSQLFCIDQG